MSIVNKNGAVNIENMGLIITPEFTVDKLHTDKHIENIQYFGSNNDYIRYVLKDIIIDDLPFFAFLLFYKNKISKIHLSCLAFVSKILSEITPEQNMLTKKKQDELLIEQHGAIKVKYSWGNIESVIGREGGAMIIITFNNSPIKKS